MGGEAMRTKTSKTKAAKTAAAVEGFKRFLAAADKAAGTLDTPDAGEVIMRAVKADPKSSARGVTHER